MKKLLLLTLALVLSACIDTKYIDSKTGKEVKPPQKAMDNYRPKEICINGAVYYQISHSLAPKVILRERLGPGKALTGVAC